MERPVSGHIVRVDNPHERIIFEDTVHQFNLHLDAEETVLYTPHDEDYMSAEYIAVFDLSHTFTKGNNKDQFGDVIYLSQEDADRLNKESSDTSSAKLTVVEHHYLDQLSNPTQQFKVIVRKFMTLEPMVFFQLADDTVVDFAFSLDQVFHSDSPLTDLEGDIITLNDAGAHFANKAVKEAKLQHGL